MKKNAVATIMTKSIITDESLWPNQKPKNPGPEIRSGFEDIGPDLAAKYLELNINNRRIRQKVIEKFTRDMLRGKWKLTHQGIAFNEDGNLIDGQHRLWAIVESGCTIRLMVTRGLSRDANEGIDEMLNRKATDILHYRGVQASAHELAIARIIITPKVNALSRAETMEAFIKHQDAINSVWRMFPSHKKKITIAAVLGAMARAWYTQERPRLSRFADVLYDGVATDDDRVIMILRDFLQTLKTVSGQTLNVEIYGKTERALHAFLTGDRISKLYVASQELFPLPGEAQIQNGQGRLYETDDDHRKP